MHGSGMFKTGRGTAVNGGSSQDLPKASTQIACSLSLTCAFDAAIVKLVCT